MDYTGPIEAALSTDLRSAPYNFSLWDIYTGSQLVVFKGTINNAIPKCLQLIDNNYFITVNGNVLQIWSIFNRKCQDQKLFLPSNPTTLCVSPCGNYLIVGISEMIYVWQIHSGNLLANVQRHYQSISVLKMNKEGNILVSGGDDGLVLVWTFADLISGTHHTGALNLDKSRKDVGVNEPRYSWQHHSAQVTDIHISNGGTCVTCSVDKTINIYSYSSGERYFNIILPSPIWSLVMNKNETKIFLGGQDGNIYEVALSCLSTSEASDRTTQPMFLGHKGKIISLVLSTDGSRLVSASVDSSCKIWDVYQRKMLQDVKHQAPLANLTSLLVPDGLALTSMTQSNSNNKPALIWKPLKRNLYKQPKDTAVMSDDLFEESTTTIVHVQNKIDQWSYSRTSRLSTELESIPSIELIQRQQLNEKSVELKSEQEAAETVRNLKAKIRDLYLLAAKKIFTDTAEESLKAFKPMIDFNTEDHKKNSTKTTAKKGKAKRKVNVMMTGDGDEADESAIDKSIGEKKNRKLNKKLKMINAGLRDDIFV